MHIARIEVYESDDALCVVFIDALDFPICATTAKPSLREWTALLFYVQSGDAAIPAFTQWLRRRDVVVRPRREDLDNNALVAVVDDDMLVIHHRRCGAAARRFFGLERRR